MASVILLVWKLPGSQIGPQSSLIMPSSQAHPSCLKLHTCLHISPMGMWPYQERWTSSAPVHQTASWETGQGYRCHRKLSTQLALRMQIYNNDSQLWQQVRIISDFLKHTDVPVPPRPFKSESLEVAVFCTVRASNHWVRTAVFRGRRDPKDWRLQRFKDHDLIQVLLNGSPLGWSESVRDRTSL